MSKLRNNADAKNSGDSGQPRQVTQKRAYWPLFRSGRFSHTIPIPERSETVKSLDKKVLQQLKEACVDGLKKGSAERAEKFAKSLGLSYYDFEDVWGEARCEYNESYIENSPNR